MLDELGANATAPASVERRGGWQLRADRMLPFRRSNAAVPLSDGRRSFDVEARIDEVEAFYRDQQMAPRFQITPAADPSDLDERLVRRRYSVEAPVDILVAEISHLMATIPTADSKTMSVCTRDEPDADWVAAFTDEPATLDRIRGYERLLGCRSQRCGVATVDIRGEPAAIGFSVIESGWVGVFGMVSRPDLRRRGAARTVLRALAQHAAVDATHVYLQVEVDNTPARALYASAGFVPNHAYHYRVLA